MTVVEERNPIKQAKMDVSNYVSLFKSDLDKHNEAFKIQHGLSTAESRTIQYGMLHHVWKSERRHFFKPADREHRLVFSIFNSYREEFQDEVLVKLGHVPITRGTFQCLKPRTWLNDELINGYMRLLDSRDALLCYYFPEDRKRSLFLSSYSILKGLRGHEEASKFSKKINIFKDIKSIYIPLNTPNTHWSLGAIDIEKKCILYYDSFHDEDQDFISLMKGYLTFEAERLKVQIDINEWLVLLPKDNPVQKDGTECGVHVLIIADHLSDNLPIEYSARDTEHWRVKIASAILVESLDLYYTTTLLPKP
jgi:sentrin-specific protease 1